MNLDIHTQAGRDVIEVADSAFDTRFNEPLVHQVVVAYLAGGRMGSKAQKNRSRVSGGSRKPWPQKRTGRARAGTSRSPIWRGGGMAFPGHPRDFSHKVNRKMYRGAMRSILSELIRQERLQVIVLPDLDGPRTRGFLQLMSGLGHDLADGTKRLLVVDEVDPNLYLASRNLSCVQLGDVRSLDPVSLIRCDLVLVVPEVIRQLEAWLA